MALQHSPSIVTTGLQLCLDAGNPRSYPGSGTAWNNAVTLGNNTTLVNGPTYSTNNGGFFSFDGVDDYTTIAIPSTTGTISFWWYYNADTVQKLIMGNANSMIYCGGGAGGGHWYNQSADYSFAFSWGNTSQWLHMCAVYESTTSNSFYINGSLAYSSSTYSLTKGTTYNVAGNFYVPQACRFSVIQVYSIALSAAQVSQNFNALRGRYGI
jgi:hypothetical protein